MGMVERYGCSGLGGEGLVKVLWRGGAGVGCRCENHCPSGVYEPAYVSWWSEDDREWVLQRV